MSKNIIVIIFLFQFSYMFSQTDEGKIYVDSSPQIEKLIAKKIEYNKTHIPVQANYKIQIFYGSENGAIRNQNKFRELFPGTSCSLEYDSPNWKVKVGYYKTRLEADKHLYEIRLTFGDAIVLEPKKQ